MIFDPIYILILVVISAISAFASYKVKSSFKKGEEIRIRSGLNGYQVAKRILDDAGIDDVEVVLTQGFLSDHYNPLEKKLALSPAVYHGKSASSAGVAAHEVGHAIQHARGYSLMWLRSVLVPAAQLGSTLGPWVIIAGIVLGAAQGRVMGQNLAWIGIILFGTATLFSLVTVPIEFDASSRAKEKLTTLGITQSGEEDDTVRSVLNAAGMTYVAAAVSSISMLLYWLIRSGLLGGRDD
jgi:uncharacterized protein